MKLPYLSFVFVLLLTINTVAPALAEASSDEQGLKVIDSLKSQLQENLHDTARAEILNGMAWEIMYSNPDSAIALCTEALEIAKKANWQYGITSCTGDLGSFNWMKGDYSEALSYYMEALRLNLAIGKLLQQY